MKNIILRTAANPIHSGHLFMIHRTLEIYPQANIYVDISENCDKTIEDLQQRANTIINLGLSVLTSNTSTFVAASNIYKESCFPIGVDTAIRVCDPKYYADSAEHMLWCLRQIGNNKCEFFVFPRLLIQFTPPKEFEFLFNMREEKPPNISSSEIRNVHTNRH